MPTVTGCSWRLAQKVDFESEQQAFDFEQAVLARLERYRMKPEREIVEARKKMSRTPGIASSTMAIGLCAKASFGGADARVGSIPAYSSECPWNEGFPGLSWW